MFRTLGFKILGFRVALRVSDFWVQDVGVQGCFKGLGILGFRN